MASTGDTLHQGDTDTLVFRATAADTGGRYVEVEATYGPMGEPPPPHYHPRQDEHFEVLEGELSVLLDGQHRAMRAGDELDLPRRHQHAMWNAGDQPVRFRWRTTPALRTEDMTEMMWHLAETGRMGRHGSPRPALLQSTGLMWAYRNEWRLTSPPAPVALPLCAVLSVPARLLGYRSRAELRPTA